MSETDEASNTGQSSQDKVDEAIRRAFEREQTTLVDALPAMGKSRGVVAWAASTGKPLSVFTSRHELYDQYEDWCEEEGLNSLILPSFYNACPTMAEDSDSDLKSQIEEVYESGISGSEIHEKATGYFGESLPCQEQGQCPYMKQREFEPENYDVLIGHYLQAHNDNYIDGRYVAFDEFPGDAFFFEPMHTEATKAITNYLESKNDLSMSDWTELDEYGYRDYAEEIEEWKENLSTIYHRDTRVTVQESPSYHAHAPLLMLAAVEFDLLDNRWRYAALGSGIVAVRSPEDEWYLLIPPTLYEAESVVALDGTPTARKWRLVLGGGSIHREEVLQSVQEKRDYLTEELGLELIQTDAGAKPYLGGDYLSPDSDGALLEYIREQEDSRPSVITSKVAERVYSSEGIDEHIEESEHYGNLKGSNKLSMTRLGVVIGSPHPGEEKAVERWAALDNESVERQEDEEGNTLRGEDLDFGPVGNELFEDAVQREVLQAAMRFGRKEENGEKGATVYIHTARLPEWVEPESRVSVNTWSKGMKAVVNVLKQSDHWPDGELTNSEITEHVEIGKKQVCELMKELDNEGYVAYRQHGVGNAYHWSDVCIKEFDSYGHVEPVG